MGIAKHDETLILKGITKNEDLLEDCKNQIETTKLRIKNLEEKKDFFVPMTYTLDEVLPPMQSLEAQLKMNHLRMRGYLKG